MYTVLVKNDNTLITTVRTNIMHRSSMVDGFRVLVDPVYKGEQEFDMKTFQCVMEYKLPISNTYTPEILTPLDELYNGKLEYRLPVNTKITSEVGNVEYKFIFIKADMDADGNVIERVRKTESNTLNVLPVAMWSDYIADAKLDSIAQIMLVNQTQNKYLESIANQLGSYADMLNMTKADSIAKDETTKELYLTANGQEIGNRVKDDGSITDKHGVIAVNFGKYSNIPEEDGEFDNTVEFSNNLTVDNVALF